MQSMKQKHGMKTPKHIYLLNFEASSESYLTSSLRINCYFFQRNNA